MTKFINKTVLVIFSFLAGFILFAKIYKIATALSGWKMAAIVLIIAAVLLLILYFGKAIYTFLYKWIDRVSAAKLLLIILTVSLVTKIAAVFIFQIDSHVHPDIKNYISFAQQISNQGFISEEALYASKYGYTVVFSLFLTPVVKLFGSSTAVISIFFSVTQTCVAFFIFSIVKKFWNKNIAFIALAFWIILPSEILLPQFAVHEMGLLFFLAFALWVFFVIIPKAESKVIKYILFGLVCVLMAVGTAINKMGIIAVIAFGIYLAAMLFSKKVSLIRVIKYAAGILSAVIIVLAGSTAIQASAQSLVHFYGDNKKSPGDVWSFYVGSNYKTGAIWTQEDYDTYTKYDNVYNTEQLKEYKTKLFHDRLTELFSSPERVAKLFVDKLSRIWSNTSFSLGYAKDTIPDPGISGVYNKFLFAPLYYVSNGILLVLAFILVCSLNRRYKSKLSPDVYFMMYLIGVTCVLMLTEVTNKYACTLPVFFILICCTGLPRFSENSERFHTFVNRRFRKNNKKS